MNLKRKYLIIFLAALFTVTASLFFVTACKKKGGASDGEDVFSYSVSGDRATVTGYKGNSADIEIPAEWNGYRVWAIGNNAFSNNLNLKSVAIPQSVTSIGSFAFENCSNLETVNIPSALDSIGIRAFKGTQIKSIAIPESVTSIGRSAFENCNSLESLTIPFLGEKKDDMSNNEHLGYIFGASNNTFNSDYVPSSLKTVTVTGGTAVGGSAFLSCHYIKSIIISEDVTTIGSSAFAGCTSLEGITIPGKVTSIGRYAFADCTSLKSITIPDSVTLIDDYAFRSCSNLASIEVSSDNRVYHSAGNCIIKTGDRALIAGCKNSIIPAEGSVTSIGTAAFDGCTGLKSVEIPDSVTFIDSGAFNGCTGLESLLVASGNPVYRSYGDCFIEMASQTLVAGCKNSIIPADGIVTSIGARAFNGCSTLKNIEIPACITSIGNSAFDKCAGLKNVTFGENSQLISMGTSAFSGCTSLKNITIPVGITSISDGVFSEAGLESIIIPERVTSIGMSAFDNCTSLKNVTLGSSVLSIGTAAFYSCSNLKSIFISESVTSIGMYAFEGCKSLEAIYYGGTVSQWNNILRGSNNTELLFATRYYYSESYPFNGGQECNFWHYDETTGEIVIWKKR